MATRKGARREGIATCEWTVTTVRCGKRRRVDERTAAAGSALRTEHLPKPEAPAEGATGDCSTAKVIPVIRWWADAAGRAAPDRGARMLEGLLGIPIDQFETDHLFKTPLIRILSETERAAALSDLNHPVHMLRMTDIDRLLRRQDPVPTRFLDDVDVTKWCGGQRVALQQGRGFAKADRVWKAFEEDGFSVRLVHPQQWHSPLYELCSCLQEYFGNVVTCSSYLTPAETQGFGPHYDDAEIFVVQLLGRKRWRLYARPDADTSPRTLAVTPLNDEDLGDVVADFVLQPGDVVYFPRGMAHQAVALDGDNSAGTVEPSLHLTFSTYRRHTWFDLLSRVPHAADTISRSEKVPGPLHNDLPLDLLSRSTVGHPDAAWERHGGDVTAALRGLGATEKATKQVRVAVKRGLNVAIDEYAKQFLTDALPPLGTPADPLSAPPTVAQTSKVRLRYRHSAWLVNNESATHTQWLGDWANPADLGEPEPELVLHVATLNSKLYSPDPTGVEKPPPPLFEVLPELAHAVVTLLEDEKQAWVSVSALPCHKSAQSDLQTLLGLLVQYHVLELKK